MKIRNGPSFRMSFLLGVTFLVSSWEVARAQSAIPVSPATAGATGTEDVPPPPPVPEEPTSQSPSASTSPSQSPVSATSPSVAVQDRRDGRLVVNPPGPNPPSSPANLVPVVLLANAGDQTLINELRHDIKELNDRLKSAGGRNDQDRYQTIYNVLKGEYSMLVGVRNADPGQLQAQQSAELWGLIRQEVGRAGEAAQAPPSAPAAASGALPPPAPGTDMSLTPGGTGLRPSPPVPPTNAGEGQPLPQPVPGGSGEWPNVAASNPGTAQVIHIVVPNTTPTTTVISPGLVTQPVVGSPVQILIPVGKHHRFHWFHRY